MGGSHLVVVREQQERPSAAVVRVAYDEHLGATRAPLIDHKLSFCSVDSHAEALYLCAFLNSTPIQDLLASFSNTTAVAPQTLARLPIPSFDPAISARLVAVAEQIFGASQIGEAVARNQQEVDESVLELLAIAPDDYRPQPADTPTNIRRRRPEPATELVPLFDDEGDR
jgi:hypothetical protein